MEEIGLWFCESCRMVRVSLIVLHDDSPVLWCGNCETDRKHKPVCVNFALRIFCTKVTP
jgi:hypothetical protein